jgi:hypothetical protein
VECCVDWERCDRSSPTALGWWECGRGADPNGDLHFSVKEVSMGLIGGGGEDNEDRARALAWGVVLRPACANRRACVFAVSCSVARRHLVIGPTECFGKNPSQAREARVAWKGSCMGPGLSVILALDSRVLDHGFAASL